MAHDHADHHSAPQGTATTRQIILTLFVFFMMTVVGHCVFVGGGHDNGKSETLEAPHH